VAEQPGFLIFKFLGVLHDSQLQETSHTPAAQCLP
jgi:hypothetical protein